MKIAGLTLVGKRREPFLSAALESVAEALDIIVVNDNGGNKENRRALEESTLFKAGKLTIIPSKFEGFASSRNLCLDYLKNFVEKDQDLWILKLDADEVHTPGIVPLTRKILPRLGPQVGGVDGYWLLFIQSFEYFARLERRHDLLFRFSPEMNWEGRVHEKLNGKSGKVLALPYLFFHYGYAASAAEIKAKWQLYRDMGDPNFDFLDKADTDMLLDPDSQTQFRLKAPHPLSARPTIEQLKTELGDNYLRFAGLIAKGQNLPNRLRLFLRYLNYRQLLWGRKMQGMADKALRTGLKTLLRTNREYQI